jgi:hypothetical protein
MLVGEETDWDLSLLIKESDICSERRIPADCQILIHGFVQNGDSQQHHSENNDKMLCNPQL